MAKSLSDYEIDILIKQINDREKIIQKIIEMKGDIEHIRGDYSHTESIPVRHLDEIILTINNITKGF